MKTKITLFALCFALFAIAQPRKKDQIKSMKIAFITQELELTPDEATKFWPLFNDFEAKQKEIRQDKLKEFRDKIDGGISEKEATTLLNQMESSEDKLHNLRKKFISNLKNVLPATKILKLKRAEEKFNRKLLKEIRDKRNN